MTSVFLSYARSDDEPFVRRLHDRLTQAGFRVWFDRLSMPRASLPFTRRSEMPSQPAVLSCWLPVLMP